MSAAALATRAFVPFIPLHTQNDDLRLAAAARGVSGMGLRGFNSDHGAVLPLYRTFLRVFGDNLEAAYLPSLIAGCLLPLLTALLAWRWWRDARVAMAAGAMALVSPASPRSSPSCKAD